MNRRRAKIVCTIGPACASPRMLDRLVGAGMNVARLNFSHGTHPGHARVIRALRAVAARRETPLAILGDLQGPKIRTGTLEDGKDVVLKAGHPLTLTGARCEGTVERVGISDPRFAAKVHPGDRILLSDGLIELRVERVRSPEVRCVVVNGGLLGQHKGVNLPGVQWNRPPLTAKDHADLAFAIRHRLSYVALSFVQSAADVRAVKTLVRRAGAHMPIIAKIEKPEAIVDLDNILDAADGVMIARGDLGVELGPEKVPVLQKRIIVRAHAHNLPVITATQMLESMTLNPRPTRAEASDVANAVFDNTDAVMLSAETATGRYPVETVRMMHRLVREAETEQMRHHRSGVQRRSSVSEAICDAVVKAAEELNIRAVAVFTEYGKTAQQVSIYRPRPPIIALSVKPVTVERLAICWGITPRLIGRVHHVEMLSRHAERVVVREGLARRGQVIAIVAGTPLGVPGHTNFMKLLTVGAVKP